MHRLVILCCLVWLCRCSAQQEVVSDKTAPAQNVSFADILSSLGKSHGKDDDSKDYRGAGKTLVYVTPWNSRGYEHTVKYAAKFDYISPVWYTIHRPRPQTYQIRGGPSIPTEESWVKQMQASRDSAKKGRGAGQGFIVPRFQLEGLGPPEYQALFTNGVEQEELVKVIMEEVEKRGYNGLVFESIATPLLEKTLHLLADTLHLRQMILIAVLPPLRRLDPDLLEALRSHSKTDDTGLLQHEEMQEQQNVYIKSAITTMSAWMDGWSIMTYDYTGPGGQWIHQGPLAGIPLSSSGGSRANLPTVPGPNSPISWLKSVGEVLTELPGSWDWEIRPKLLMGIPFYGYAYQTVRVDPTTGLQLKRGEQSARGMHARILTSSGTAIISDRIHDILKKHEPRMLWDDLAKEHYFDYIDSDEDAIKGGHQPGHGHEWRVYIPSVQGIQERLDLFSEMGTGISVWELGQSDESLVSLL